MKRIITSIVGLFVFVMLAGCIDIEERLNIDTNGFSTLRTKIRFTLPEDKKRKVNIKEEDFADMGDGLKDVTFDVKTETLYGQLITTMTFRSDRFSALQDAYASLPKKEPGENEPSFESIFSKRNFYKIKRKGKNLQITRTVGGRGKKRRKGKKDKLDSEIADMMLGMMKVRFDLDVPTRIISSNAESVDGQTLEWVLPLSYLEKKKVTLKAVIESTPELTQALLKK